MTVTIGSAFTGAGGLDMAVSALFPDAQLSWFSELPGPAADVFAHHHPGVPNLGDITAVDWQHVEPVDILGAGFPCQDISHAGKGAGITEGTRSGLWFRLIDAIRVLRPRILLVENVAAIASPGRGLDVVLGSLAEVGWDAEWAMLRASDVGAPHRRDRWFAVAWPADTDLAGLEGRDAGGVRERAVERSAGQGDPRPDLTNLPTPAASLGRGTGTPSYATAYERQVVQGKRNLDDAVAMLPTPAAQEPGGTVEQYHDRLHRHDGPSSTFTPLGMLVKVLPTPRTLPTPTSADSRGTRNSTAIRYRIPPTGVHAGDTLSDVAHADRWGDYGPAISRWEQILGRPAPDPTDDKGRLSPAFVEWMMGWPQGWVDLDGTSRAHRLHMLGNGVVPQQAYAAYAQLLPRAG